MATMKAVRLHEFGGPDVLKYEDAPRPEAGPNEVLIQVRASSVNPADWKIREGYFEKMIPHTLPLILGLNAAGIVESVGENVTEFKPGDEVFASVGMIKDGSYAEYVTADVGAMALKPKTADFSTAASVPTALTAWQALFDIAHLSAGQTVLIHGAGGAVGSAAVQFAKNSGARVIATASAQDLDYVRDLGADTVVDYKTERFEDAAPPDVDVVLDTVGGETQARSFTTMKQGGILVATTAPPDLKAAEAHGVTAQMIQMQANAAQLREIAQLMDTGKFQVRVGLILPLSEARQAQEKGQAGQVRGKIALVM